MKFLADVNIEKRIVDFLREQNYDVLWMLEDLNTLDDQSIVNIANSESRILITNDKDFGDIVFRQKLLTYGIILLRISDQDVDKKIEMLKVFLKDERKLSKKFIVIKDKKIRVIKL